AGQIAGLLFKPPPLASRAARRLAPVSLPKPTGHLPVGTETFVATDPGREGRKIPVQVWYPAVASGAKASTPSTYALPATSALLAQQFGVPVRDVRAIRTNAAARLALAHPPGRLPVVLFSPGLGVPRPLYSGLGAELASHGYVVAVMDHPGDGQLVEFPDGTTVPGPPPADEAALTALLATRVADARAVLDLLQRLNGQSGGRLSKALDLDRVDFVGHSFGGATAAETMRLDRRFRAGVNLDGTMSGAVLETGLDRPFLLVSSDHPQGEDDESWTAFRRHTARAREMLIAGSAHMSFTDQPALSSLRPAAEPRDPAQLGTIEPARSFAVQSAYVLAFLDQQLRGTSPALLDGPSATYPEVRFG
ncbi:MAG: alpha/beta hydrolase family protein, partial [Acidimicrobiales bacterium]